MTTQANQLLEDAKQLSAADRADMAALLIESLDPSVDQDVDDAWQREIARRVAELDSGNAVTVPWSEVRRRLLDGPDGESNG